MAKHQFKAGDGVICKDRDEVIELRNLARKNGYPVYEPAIEYGLNKGIFFDGTVFTGVGISKVANPISREEFIRKITGATHNISLPIIRAAVYRYYNINESHCSSRLRHTNYCTARHMFFYMATIFSGLPYLTIGAFADRDHCTVVHAVKKIRAHMSVYPSVATDVKKIEQIILGPQGFMEKVWQDAIEIARKEGISAAMEKYNLIER